MGTTQKGTERAVLIYTRRKKVQEKSRLHTFSERLQQNYVQQNALSDKVNNILERVKTLKWRWAGYIARRDDDRWIKTVLEWTPRDMKTPRGNCLDSWDRDTRRVVKVNWKIAAQAAFEWKKQGIAEDKSRL